MTQKAAALYDAGDDMAAGEAANMAKYAAAEAACARGRRARCRPTAATASPQEYGMAGLLVAARAGRIAPGEPGDDPELRRDAPLGLPKSYSTTSPPRAPQAARH